MIIQQVSEKRRTFSTLGLVQKSMMYSHHTVNITDCSTIKLISRVERCNKELLIWDKLYKGGFRKKQENRGNYINIYASKYMCVYICKTTYLQIHTHTHIYPYLYHYTYTHLYVRIELVN